MKRLFIVLIFIDFVLFAQATAQVTDYSNPYNWAAHPMKGTQDIQFSPSYTFINPDTSLGPLVTVNYDTSSNYDVFSVHPTILIESESPSHNITIGPVYRISASIVYKWLFSQFAQFGRIYAPYYRQANLYTFSESDMNLQAQVLDTAVTDIIAAFEYYMQNNNNNKKIILVGHSQGAYVLAMMLRKFETDPQRYQAYLDKIFLSVLVGMIGGPFVENSSKTGGWWKTIPIGQNPLDTASVMSWATFKNDQIPFPIGFKNGIVFNDSLVSKGFIYTTFDSLTQSIKMDPLGFIPAKTVAYSIYPVNHKFFSTHSTYGVTTDFIGYTNMYRGSISNPNSSNYRLLIENIQDQNDLRTDPLELSQTFSSLHTYDMYVAIGDVINLIWQKINQSLTGISTDNNSKNQSPNSFVLKQNYPNPFNPSTSIFYLLFKSGFIQITIYDILGRSVRRLVNEEKPVGKYTVVWDGKNEQGKNVSSGIYYYKLQAGKFFEIKKMVLMR